MTSQVYFPLENSPAGPCKGEFRCASRLHPSYKVCPYHSIKSILMMWSVRWGIRFYVFMTVRSHGTLNIIGRIKYSTTLPFSCCRLTVSFNQIPQDSDWREDYSTVMLSLPSYSHLQVRVTSSWWALSVGSLPRPVRGDATVGVGRDTRPALRGCVSRVRALREEGWSARLGTEEVWTPLAGININTGDINMHR